MASTTSTCHTDSCESAAVISAQWSLNSSTMMPVSAASTSSENVVFLREGAAEVGWLIKRTYSFQKE